MSNLEYLELRKNCAACRFQRCKTVGMCEADVQWHRDANGPLKVPRQTDGVRSTKSKSIDTPPAMDTFGQSSSSSSSHSLSNCSIASAAPTTSSTCSSPFEHQQMYSPCASLKTSLLHQIQTHVQEFFRSEKALYTILHPDRCNGDVIVVSYLHFILS